MTNIEFFCKNSKKPTKPVESIKKFSHFKYYELLDYNGVGMNINKKIFTKYQKEANLGKSTSVKNMDKQFLSRFSSYVRKPFDEVTKDDVINFLTDMENGTIKNKWGKSYGKYTVEQYKSQIKKFFKWYYKWEEGMAIPEVVRGLKVNVNKAYKRKTRNEMLDPDEIQILIDSCDNLRDKAIISVMYDGAFRLGEFFGMKIGDIFKDKDGKTGITVDGKTGQGIGWLNMSVSYLENYLETHPDKDNLDAPVWQLSYSRIQQLIYEIAEQSPVKKHISPHILRHSRIRHLSKQGMTEKEQRVFARWSKDSTMPSVYGAIDGEDVKERLFKIEKQQKVYNKKEVDNKIKDLEKQVDTLTETLAELMNNKLIKKGIIPVVKD